MEYINLKALRTDIPDEIATFYVRERYVKSLNYHRELTRFSFLSSTFSFAISIAMLLAGVFGWLDAMKDFQLYELWEDYNKSISSPLDVKP